MNFDAMMKDAIENQKPTTKQAVEILTRTITENQRIANLAHWRYRYGEKFAEEVEAEYRNRARP